MTKPQNAAEAKHLAAITENDGWEGVTQTNGGSALTGAADGTVYLSVLSADGNEAVIALTMYEADQLGDALRHAMLEAYDQKRNT